MRHELRWFVSLLGFRDVRRDVIPRLGNFHARRLDSADGLAPETFELAAKFKCAYADVASGKRFKGKSRTLKELRKFADT